MNRSECGCPMHEHPLKFCTWFQYLLISFVAYKLLAFESLLSVIGINRFGYVDAACSIGNRPPKLYFCQYFQLAKLNLMRLAANFGLASRIFLAATS
jgi:hypothetical protein